MEDSLEARGLFDWFEKVVDKTKEKLNNLKDKFGESFDSIVKELGEVGDKTFDNSVSLNLDAGVQGERKNIYTDITK